MKAYTNKLDKPTKVMAFDMGSVNTSMVDSHDI